MQADAARACCYPTLSFPLLERLNDTPLSSQGLWLIFSNSKPTHYQLIMNKKLRLTLLLAMSSAISLNALELISNGGHHNNSYMGFGLSVSLSGDNFLVGAHNVERTMGTAFYYKDVLIGGGAGGNVGNQLVIKAGATIDLSEIFIAKDNFLIIEGNLSNTDDLFTFLDDTELIVEDDDGNDVLATTSNLNDL